MRHVWHGFGPKYLLRCGESGVEESLVVDVGHALDLVVVERELAGQRAVETRFGERRPRVLEDQLTAGVVFADARHARVNHLLAPIWIF